MEQPLVVAITGAGSGIGLRATARLTARGHTVLALVRDPARAQPAIAGATAATPGSVEIVRADLSDPTSVREAAEHITARGRLDALINNAAVFDQTQRTPLFTETGHELVWATNHLGPWELTARLSPALARAPKPRVVFVASKGLITMPRIAIRWDALDSPDWYTPVRAYYHAKLAQVMTAQSLADRAGDAVDVTCIRVPAVRLDADRHAAMPAVLRFLYAPKNAAAAPPEQLAETYADAVQRWEPSSHPYVDEKLARVALPRFAADPANRDRLWQLTAAAVGNPVWAWA